MDRRGSNRCELNQSSRARCRLGPRRLYPEIKHCDAITACAAREDFEKTREVARHQHDVWSGDDFALRDELVEPFPRQDHHIRRHASAKLGADGCGPVSLRRAPLGGDIEATLLLRRRCTSVFCRCSTTIDSQAPVLCGKGRWIALPRRYFSMTVAFKSLTIMGFDLISTKSPALPLS
jgi:hypothetical protein